MTNKTPENKDTEPEDVSPWKPGDSELGKKINLFRNSMLDFCREYVGKRANRES